MGNAPALGNVEVEQFRELRGGLGSDGILPGAEGSKQIPFLVKGQIAVHHTGNAHGCDTFPVFNAGQGRFQPCPNLIQVISPDSVFVSAGPGIITARYGIVFFINGNRLDSCGAKLDA